MKTKVTFAQCLRARAKRKIHNSGGFLGRFCLIVSRHRQGAGGEQPRPASGRKPPCLSVLLCLQGVVVLLLPPFPMVSGLNLNIDRGRGVLFPADLRGNLSGGKIGLLGKELLNFFQSGRGLALQRGSRQEADGQSYKWVSSNAKEVQSPLPHLVADKVFPEGCKDKVLGSKGEGGGVTLALGWGIQPPFGLVMGSPGELASLSTWR